ncbi:MAG: DUF6514 family protein [Oscillospiraceae bacterium]|nr:DUF6514 family protein [Oscillospiraceae bacterium]
MVTYKVTESLDERKGICTYGIAAVDSGEILAEISDISANRAALSELSQLMNREKLSLIHFKDVVEDFLFMEY